MSVQAVRMWTWLHKWSSLVCTLFMLLLGITGLPLIFSHEIDHLTGNSIEAPAMPAGASRASLEAVAKAAVAYRPGLVPLYFFSEEDDPNLWLVKLDQHVASDEQLAQFATVDARTAQVLGSPEFGQGFMHVMYRLHVDLFFNLAGKLFLGLMGALLIIAIVSGVVLYAPFMRKLAFGTVRAERSPRIRWLDLHNLLGIATVVWMLIVGGTGVINTWADLILKAWQSEQISKLQQGRTQIIMAADPGLVAGTSGIDLSVTRALKAFPEMQVEMIAFPGTLRSTPEHFAIILRGSDALTARLTQAVLVNPTNGEVLQAGARPWYVTMLQLSQPLHFGDYGELPLKILWALLDLIMIVVTGSGLYLWWSRANQKKAVELSAPEEAGS